MPADTEPRDDPTRAGGWYRTEMDALARAGDGTRPRMGKAHRPRLGDGTGLRLGWLVGWFERSQLLSNSISFSPLCCDDRAGSI